MGFPENEAKAALRAANGNSNLAVEFLMNGIPENELNRMTAQRNTNSRIVPPTNNNSTTTTPVGLEALRNHPQFNSLRRLVQSNPSSLQHVLQQIGQQSPELLQAIHANQEAFLQMMNEPITDDTQQTTGNIPQNLGSGNPGLGNAGISPSQMAQLISSMSLEQRTQLAQSMGIEPQQLTALSQLIGQLPQEQFDQLMNNIGSGNLGGQGGLGTGGLGPGLGNERGQHVIRLTQEEADAVNRLVDLGFDRQEALQAYLACDKNEALAANFLMDGMMDDQNQSGGNNNTSGNNNNNSGNNNNGNDEDDYDDNMYS